MPNAEFKIKSIEKGFVVIDPGKKETTIPNKGDAMRVSLEPDQALSIVVKENGKLMELGENFYIQLWPPKGLNCQLKTTEDKIKCEIKLESLPSDQDVLGITVTVGDGKPG